MNTQEAELLASHIQTVTESVQRLRAFADRLVTSCGHAASPTPPCPVTLRGEGADALVCGDELPTVTGAAYRALVHLVSIYPNGVRREELNRIAETKDASSVLNALRRRDQRWAGVLRFPRGKGDIRSRGGLYLIASPLTGMQTKGAA